MILLLNLQIDPSPIHLNLQDCVLLQDFETPILDTTAALEECFRCLLTAGMQATLARGIARMLYQFAMKVQPHLPPKIRDMLQIVSGSIWQPKDLARIDSNYCVFDVDGTRSNARMQEMLQG